MNKSLVYNPKLLKALEIESNYQRHKTRLLQIRTNNSVMKPSKRDGSLDGINNYRKNRILSDLFKVQNKHTRLAEENKLIHTNLKNLYRKRPSSSTSSVARAMSERELILPPKNLQPERDRQRLISEENIRLRKKLLSAKSTFSTRNPITKPTPSS